MEQIKDSAEKPKRPLIISIICILNFISLPFYFAMLTNPETKAALEKDYGSAYVPTAFVLAAFSTVAIMGLWRMKRWGVCVFTAAGIIGLLYDLFYIASDKTPTNLLSYLFEILFITIIIAHYKKMT
ncbi:MAG: DUF2127 domain-containing protein [Deltaproteobacteria bacterium]|nr:DUF2127 domain-containing protein [Deltaproteobacteria bacterium]